MRTRAFFALTFFAVFLSSASPAGAGTLTLFPIDYKGEAPGPFAEVFQALLWEATFFRIDSHQHVDLTSYNRAQEALDDANLNPEDLLNKKALIDLRKDLDRDAFITVHITVTPPKPPKKKTDKPKPYTYNISVFIFNGESQFHINVLKTTLKPKKASITAIAAMIEKSVVEKGGLAEKFKDKPKVAENDKTFSDFYHGHAKKASDLKQKERSYRKALYLNPGDKKLWVEYISELVKEKQKDTVFEVFREAETCFPDDADLLVYHAEMASQYGKKKDAFEIIEKALKIKPDNFRALLLKAQMLYDDGKYKEAREIYTSLAEKATLEEVRKEIERYIKECDGKIAKQEAGKKPEESPKK